MSTTVESPDVPAPEAPRPRSAPARAWSALGPSRWILAMLVVLLAVFSAIQPDSFPSGPNFRNVGVDASVLLVLAIGRRRDRDGRH
jgi:ribose transport system permease protein